MTVINEVQNACPVFARNSKFYAQNNGLTFVDEPLTRVRVFFLNFFSTMNDDDSFQDRRPTTVHRFARKSPSSYLHGLPNACYVYPRYGADGRGGEERRDAVTAAVVA